MPQRVNKLLADSDPHLYKKERKEKKRRGVNTTNPVAPQNTAHIIMLHANWSMTNEQV